MGDSQIRVPLGENPSATQDAPSAISSALWERFAARAAQLGIAPHELLRLLLEDFLSGPDADFAEDADYLLTRYEDLLRRLA